ncbi:MAG: nuclear transport factor 2 family protein [Bacteroidota bacterium]|nr:nuclear transport factor 2 family protein [Bacteroidota bacterium]
MSNTIKYSKLIVSLLFIFLNSARVSGQNTSHPVPDSDSLDVLKSTNEFLDAFRTLDWKRFSESFAEDATAFFPPSAKFPYRANNKKEIEDIFKKVFENARKQRSQPPYIDILPKDLKIQMIGDGAIVTFLLEDPDLLGRRTLVFKKNQGKWLIIHLHASGVITAKEN